MRDPSTAPVVWTIAGFDPSSGAGVTADLMTFAAHGLFGCSAITALTVQSTLGVKAVAAVSPDLLAHALATLQEDLPPSGVKIGMLATPEIMRVVAQALLVARRESLHHVDTIHPARKSPQVVLDPVLRSSSGLELYPSSGLGELHELLLPLVDIITPNWSELAALTGGSVDNLESAEEAAKALVAKLPRLHVIVTGGDQIIPVDILVSPTSKTLRFEGERIISNATHGTGCAFSSALLANLALAMDLPSAAKAAKTFVSEAIRQAPGIGHGKGPINLLWNRPLPAKPQSRPDNES